MSTIALIPARGGSKGIPRKNIKLFNSKPLIFWTIKAAIESKFVDRVIVSTDDEEIADISKSFSAEVPFLRPKELAQDHSSGIDPVIHAINNLQDVKDILLLQPTSPLRRTKDIDEILQILELDNLIEKLPNKLMTICRDNGKIFSGGQKQRILIGRGLLRNKPYLFADEITNSLNKKLATRIVKKIINYQRKRNSSFILITHDESLLELFDQVFFMKG